MNRILIVLLVVSFFYPLGINEQIIHFISSATRIPIYESIKFYNHGVDLFYGFNVRFYLYTLFFSISSFVIYILFCIRNQVIEDALKMYMVFNVYFFVVGFAAFANRYAFVAWNFIPILIIMLYIGLRVKINHGIKVLILYLVSCISIFLFLSNFSVFKL